jgi:hypothetical protein
MDGNINMDACLKDRLVQTIGRGRVSGYSTSGTPSGTSITDVKAYVEVKTGFVAGPNGSEKRTTHLVITEAEVQLDDDIWLPGLSRTDSNRRKPAQVDVFYDTDTGAVDHYEVRL